MSRGHPPAGTEKPHLQMSVDNTGQLRADSLRIQRIDLHPEYQQKQPGMSRLFVLMVMRLDYGRE